RVLAWWRSRDPLEQRRLELWWIEGDPGARDRALRAWWRRLPEPVRVSLRWPDWEARTQAEQEEALAAPPATLPAALWRDLLAWVAWEDLEGEERVAAVRREVGPVAATMARLQF